MSSKAQNDKIVITPANMPTTGRQRYPYSQGNEYNASLSVTQRHLLLVTLTEENYSLQALFYCLQPQIPHFTEVNHTFFALCSVFYCLYLFKHFLFIAVNQGVLSKKTNAIKRILFQLFATKKSRVDVVEKKKLVCKSYLLAKGFILYQLWIMNNK